MGDTLSTMIACGNHHSACLDSSGFVWTFGDNEFGQLGHGDQENRSLPEQIDSIFDIVSISCGEYFTACLDAYGCVWTFGDGRFGQLGHGNCKSVNIPTKVENLPPIRSVYCGAYHTVCIDESSELWVFGDNSEGQLGLGHWRGVSSPKPVITDSPIEIASCGGLFTLIMDFHGRIFSTGRNALGALGIGSEDDRQCSFVKMKNAPRNICSISSGWNHTVMLSNEGDLYAFGDGGYGRLGLGNYQNRSTPCIIPNIPKMKVVSCGGRQTRCIDMDGNLWRCGFNGYGELGGYQSNLVKLTRDPSIKVNCVYSGATSYHAFLVEENDHVYCCGYNNQGQLGIGNTRSQFKVTELPSEVSQKFIKSRMKSARK